MQSFSLNDYCNILGVKPNSSVAEIKAAFRAKAKELHPDLNPSPSAHEQFVELFQAYEYLLNPPPVIDTLNSSKTVRRSNPSDLNDAIRTEARIRAQKMVKWPSSFSCQSCC